MLGMAFLDGTAIRAHQKAAGASGKKGPETGTARSATEALDLSRGGFGTKACVIADGTGRLSPLRWHPDGLMNCPWRAVATHYEKTANSFLGVLCLAAALDWLKR
jgi:hypothetical protein